MKEVTILNIGHAIAYTSYGRDGLPYIAVNKNLERYDKELYEDVIKHEVAHIDSGNKVIDLKHELTDFFQFKKNFKLFFFMLRHPYSFTAMLPLSIEKNAEIDIKVNAFMSILWVLLGVALWVM